MKQKIILMLMFLTGAFFTVKAQTQFWSDTFEDVGAPSSGTRTPSITFECGGTPPTAYFKRTNLAGVNLSAGGSYTNVEGSKFWAGEDIDKGNGSCTNNSISANQQVTWSGIDIAGKSGLMFKGNFAASATGGWQGKWWQENQGGGQQDFLAFEYRIDGGSWVRAIAFYSNSPATVTGGSSPAMYLDTDGDMVGDGTMLTSAFAEYTFNIPSTGSSLDIRMNCFANASANQELAIDNFRLFGSASCVTPVITSNIENKTACIDGNTSFSIAADNATGYQWQVNTGSEFTNITDGGVYSGSNTNTLSLIGVLNSMNAYTYRCVAYNGNTACFTNSEVGILTVSSINLTLASQTNVACNGGATGAAAVNVATGGTGSYTYNWTPGNPAGDGTTAVNGLTAGTWTCTVTDTNGCSASASFTITEPASSVNLFQASQTNISCQGANTGAASVAAATGGTGPYTYNWTPGNPTGDGTTAVFGLAPGVWTCTATDVNGCSESVSFTITEPANALGVTQASQTNIACHGGATGAAAVNVATGGTGSYTYNWTPGNPAGDGTTAVNGLTAGTWTCTVTDTNGCSASASFTITEPASSVNLFQASQTNISCQGSNTGAASVAAATGGTGPYTYDWTPGNPTGDGTTAVFGLAPGVWTCTATDVNGCSKSVSFTITEPANALGVTQASQTNIACNGGATGAAAVNVATGGTGSYTYNWTPGNPTGDGTTAVNGLTAGTWTCTVTDTNGCSASASFTITEPAVLSSPVGDAMQSFYQGATIADLVVEGSNLTWYDALEGGDLLEMNTVLNGGTTYFVSQSSAGCESDRLAITVQLILPSMDSDLCGSVQNLVFYEPLIAEDYPGATQYEFMLTGDGLASNFISSTNQIIITDFDGAFGFDYGTTYQVSVRAMVGDVWTPFGAACEFSIIDSPLTSVQAFCDMTIPNVNSKIYFYHVPQATQYRYSITNLTTNIESFIETNSRFFLISTADNFDFGTNFSLKCQVQIDGVYGEFGEACVVTTPSQITSLRDQFCGLTISTLDSNLYASNVVYAEAYKFRAQAGLAVFEVERPDSRVTMSMFGAVSPNTSYAVSVAVKINNVWSDYGASCLIQTPASIVLPTLRSEYCDTTLENLSSNFYATITFGASAYRFKTTIGGEVVIVERPDSRCYVGLFEGATIGQTYAIEVSSFLNGVWSSYGEPCAITIPNLIPTTTLRSQFCGSTVSSLGSNFYASVRFGATAYRFKTMINGLEVVVERSDSRCFMSAFAGAEENQTYDIQVAVQIQNMWGAYGPACSLTVGSISSKEIPVEIDADLFEIKAYPNPFTTQMNLILSENGATTSIITVYDMTGKQIELVETSDAEISLGQSWTTGVYLIQIERHNVIQHIRMIKQ
uniref:T9SS type A sorting domain-containing protein n=1 Tax=Flavobacterium sp. TaxID=239 RepID=UPI00404A1DF8